MQLCTPGRDRRGGFKRCSPVHLLLVHQGLLLVQAVKILTAASQVQTRRIRDKISQGTAILSSLHVKYDSIDYGSGKGEKNRKLVLRAVWTPGPIQGEGPMGCGRMNPGPTRQSRSWVGG